MSRNHTEDKKDSNHIQISAFVKSLGFEVEDFSSMKNGRPDVNWYKQHGQYIAVEYKSKTGKLTTIQKEWWDNNYNIRKVICRSISDALDILCQYGWITKENREIIKNKINTS